MWIVQDRSWGISRLRPRIDDPSWATSWRPINTLDPGETNPKSTRRTNLVGGFNPSEKYEFVSWDYSSQHMEKWKMFQTTNQKQVFACFCWLLHIGTYSNHPNLYPFVVKKEETHIDLATIQVSAWLTQFSGTVRTKRWSPRNHQKQSWFSQGSWLVSGDLFMPLSQTSRHGFSFIFQAGEWSANIHYVYVHMCVYIYIYVYYCILYTQPSCFHTDKFQAKTLKKHMPFHLPIGHDEQQMAAAECRCGSWVTWVLSVIDQWHYSLHETMYMCKYD